MEITDEIIAQNKVERFVSRFESSYRLLACHAALPLVLTPELVNYLRVQFLKSEGVPWIAEADLLLSDLCRPVGYELYVMDEAGRAYLLNQLEQDGRFGEKRIREIAHLLLNYVNHLAKTNPFLGKKDIQTQKWGAMLYLDTEQTVREIATAINESIINKAEISRLYKITEDFKQQIDKSQTAKPDRFQDLLKYAQVVNDLLRKPEIVKTEAITSSYQIAGNNLTVPESLVNSSIKTFKVATIEIKETHIEIKETHIFDFTIATLERQLGKGKQKEWVINRQQSQAEGIIEVLGAGIELEMIKIPTGTFSMGAPDKELNSNNSERPQHKVTVPSFYMGRYPITQAQWKLVAELPQVNKQLDPDPSRFKGTNRPVESVFWYDAVEFCSRLSQYTGRTYRLPSEAEWEYACRAGTTTPFHFGETITADLANYDGRNAYGQGPKGVYREETTEVGSFGVANNFGLYDMHGNVREWCLDDWHDKYTDAPVDGSALFNDANLHNGSRYAVLRGGSWVSNPGFCRSAYRDYSYRVGRDLYADIGFRVVCVVGRTL
ncbi:formylglycine-generating enzyme family protein [Anabaena cylindrica FACHB-243]|nr:formylglycine-generating enzyme family protein [Anabaena cylindrica]MBD2418231.1 formylglycine-generating enzyme family protein [Anabaena cylindrica FACHB-243]MBY5285224.1 formylglycine-generating enzyme family protein [Anabaena sp. CCAP 1446/1C]MBY5311213.1 formylglycine-generating enzyme family protein [Anabaena sp. CCAP 1446/1C]